MVDEVGMVVVDEVVADEVERVAEGATDENEGSRAATGGTTAVSIDASFSSRLANGFTACRDS